MSTKLFKRLALTALLVSLVFISNAGFASELAGLARSQRSVNGLALGKLNTSEYPGGWFSSLKTESMKESDFLTIDMAGKTLNPAEGSAYITIRRSEYPLANGETLFGFASADLKTRFWVTAVWADQPNNFSVALNNLTERFVVTGHPLQVPAQDSLMTVGLAWRSEEIFLYVDGVPLAMEVKPTADPLFLTNKLSAVSKVFIGGIPTPNYPSGAYDPLNSKVVGFGVYDSFEEWKAGSALSTVTVDKSVYGPGQTIKASINGVPGVPASFTVEGVAANVVMRETAPGNYSGEAIVPSGTNLEAAKLTGSLIYKGITVTRSGMPVTLDSTPPAAPAKVFASAKWGGELEVSWDASVSKDAATYKVYRSVGVVPSANADPYNETSALSFTDTDVIPGLTYYYAVAAVDRADNTGALSDSTNAKVLPGEGPSIASVLTDPLGKPMRPGQIISFSIKGATKGSAQVDILGLGRVIDLAEVGKSGVYQGSYTITAGDSAATTTAYQVVGKLTDEYGSSKFAGPQLVVVGKDILGDATAPTVSSVEHDGYRIAGFSGRLVAGDVITVTMEGEAKGFASFSLVGVTAQIPMTETLSGVYKGSYTIDWSNRGSAIPVEASLSDLAGNETRLVSASTIEIDTRVRLAVTANDLLLPADKTSKTRIVVKTTDANGDDVSGHELMLKLHTTDEYTGVVGGGKVANRFASKDDEDDIEVKWGGVTDSFGEVAATYTAGFAAKTALIIAKDLSSGDVGAGWLNTFVASTIAIQLTPASAREASIAPVVKMAVTPGWLTADGRSKARVRAWLTESDGTAIKGARIRFELASENGSIKTLRGITDATGMAEADYRAGTVAGFVTILAVAPDDKVTGSVQIELKSDAPAKIGLVSTVVSLPADGRSTSTVRALVTDINDNPNKQAPVSFSLIEGTGSVSSDRPITDDRGLVSAVFTAGKTVGTAVIEARHTSRAPNIDELRRVYGTIFVPRLVAGIEKEKIRVDEWYAKPGDKVVRGQALVKIASKGQSWLLHAQEDGVLASQVRHKKDLVELGDTIGYVEIDGKVWKTNYAK